MITPKVVELACRLANERLDHQEYTLVRPVGNHADGIFVGDPVRSIGLVLKGVPEQPQVVDVYDRRHAVGDPEFRGRFLIAEVVG